MRGYLAGRGWKDYQRDRRGLRHPLPAGLRESDRLPEPIFTPSTKAEGGARREHRLRDDGRARRRATSPSESRDIALALYGFAAAARRAAGIILADTKFEFGHRSRDRRSCSSSTR